MLFGFKSPFETFNRIKKFFGPYYEMWTNAFEVMTKKIHWMECPLQDVDPDEVDNMIKQSVKTLARLQRNIGNEALSKRVLTALANEVSDLNEWLPTIEVLCNPCLKGRHWLEIQKIANAPFNSQETSLNEIKYFNVKDYLE